jgi:hypothetical protein
MNNTLNRSDVYSFGIICWELATRDQPFSEYAKKYPSRHKIVHAIIHEELRPTFPENSQCPQSFMQLTQRCWSGDPKKRPPFHEVVKELISILKNEFGYQKSSLTSISTKKSALKLTQTVQPCQIPFNISSKFRYPLDQMYSHC